MEHLDPDTVDHCFNLFDQSCHPTRNSVMRLLLHQQPRLPNLEQHSLLARRQVWRAEEPKPQSVHRFYTVASPGPGHRERPEGPPGHRGDRRDGQGSARNVVAAPQ